MKSKEKFVWFGIFILLLIVVSIELQINEKSLNYDSEIRQINPNGDLNENQPKLATNNNYDNILAIFNAKLNDYNSLGYFPQIYEPSLQATYYALYILDAIDKLNQINQTAITNYIMSHYNASTQIFMDKYAYRYLDTDIDLTYYPWTSVLEVNCYAILSLSILGRLDLDLIDIQGTIDFIWSCYNPITSGFIGQPYDINLPEYFKISLMDNTYFAVYTLDLLLNNDWSAYLHEKTDIIFYINGLQSTDTWEARKGGFYNNEDTAYEKFNTMFSNFDPNLVSSYYCLKTLELFGSGALGTINQNDFKSFLGQLYQPNNNFIINYFGEQYNPMDLVATSIGIELSDIVGYTGINREGAIDYILNNKNQLGGWNSSTSWNCYELIDTFQIIRSLQNIGELSRLSENDKNDIVSYLELFKQYKGYSLISNDYASLKLIYSIVNSFDLYNKIFDGLDISGIYDSLLKACFYYPIPPTYHYFEAFTQFQGALSSFRSRPIEYYNHGFHRYIEKIDVYKSHKTTFMALDTMLKTLKLDDFASIYDLNNILDSIINSQFLENGYDKFGLFLPLKWIKDACAGYPEIQNKLIIFEHSYYAIKSLEMLASHLGMGRIKDLGFNVASLYNYIINNIIETPDTIHFNPHNSRKADLILQNTYYMVYILKALDLYGLDNQKIQNFLLQNIDYSNIRSVYYSFKISEILNLDFPFDFRLTQDLVRDLYSEDVNEYFETTDKREINQEIFLWICDMAKNDEIKIECDYKDTIYLGDGNTITVLFNNIILDDFGPNINVKFEDSQLGTFTLNELSNNIYEVTFMVPIDPQNYPSIDGFINIYEGNKVIGQLPISIQTLYELTESHIIEKLSSNIQIEINASYTSFSGPSPTLDSNVIAEVLVNNTLLGTPIFSREDFTEFSIFSLNYDYIKEELFYFNIFMFDEYHPAGLNLFDSVVNTSVPASPPAPPNDPDPPDPAPPTDPDPSEPEPDPIDDDEVRSLFYILIVATLGITAVAAAALGICIFIKWLKNKNNLPGKRLSIVDNELDIQRRQPIERNLMKLYIDDLTESLFEDLK